MGKTTRMWTRGVRQGATGCEGVRGGARRCDRVRNSMETVRLGGAIHAVAWSIPSGRKDQNGAHRDARGCEGVREGARGCEGVRNSLEQGAWEPKSARPQGQFPAEGRTRMASSGVRQGAGGCEGVRQGAEFPGKSAPVLRNPRGRMVNSQWKEGPKWRPVGSEGVRGGAEFAGTGRLGAAIRAAARSIPSGRKD